MWDWRQRGKGREDRDQVSLSTPAPPPSTPAPRMATVAPGCVFADTSLVLTGSLALDPSPSHHALPTATFHAWCYSHPLSLHLAMAFFITRSPSPHMYIYFFLFLSPSPFLLSASDISLGAAPRGDSKRCLALDASFPPASPFSLSPPSTRSRTWRQRAHSRPNERVIRTHKARHTSDEWRIASKSGERKG